MADRKILNDVSAKEANKLFKEAFKQYAEGGRKGKRQ